MLAVQTKPSPASMSRGSLPTEIGRPAIVPMGRGGVVATVVGSVPVPPPPPVGRSSSTAPVATPARTSTAASISATVLPLLRDAAGCGPDGYDGGPGGYEGSGG